MKHIESCRLWMLSAAVFLAAGAAVPACAQDPDDLKRGVARISLMDGDVSVRRGDSGDWVAGVINAPLLTGDRISTGPNSRAEVEFDAANILRLGGNAEVHLAQLEDGRYQIEVARGTVTYRVLRPSSANVEVDTPSVSVRPANQGTYRIAVGAAGDSEITARAGNVEVFTPRGSQWVNAGQTMRARGTTADPEFQITAANPMDDWDRWNDSRDQALLGSTSYQHVGQGVYGVEDLDQNGVWSEVPPYGNVWRPTVVDPGWAPYRNGRWTWLDWYGWSWVSYDSWGWAPYHYGRWFNDPASGWCWYPGGMGMRHYWSPALVGFFGYGMGGGFGFGFGFGNIGWVPLAPYEVLHPWWGRGFYGGAGFNRSLNVTNVNIANVYRNARVANGISGINAADFRSGRFNNIGRVSGDQMRTAGLVRGQMPMTPTSANLRFSDRQASAAARSGANTNTRFFSHQQATPAARVPFAQQQRGLEQAGGHTAEAGNAMRSGSTGTATSQGQAGSRQFGGAMGTRNAAPRASAMQPGGASGAAPRSAPSATSGSTSGGGWQRFGNPGGSQYAPRSTQGAAQGAPAQNGGGWNRFGTPGASRQSVPQYRGNPGGSYNAPSRQSAPQYRAPSGGGGGSYSAPRSSGGGGGGHVSSGGGHSGGGGHSHR